MCKSTDYRPPLFLTYALLEYCYYRLPNNVTHGLYQRMSK